MKKFFTILAIVLLSVVSGRIAAQQPENQISEQQKQTVLSFDTMDHDFGRIAEKGGRVTVELGFVNTGTTPVVITDARVSCKCTTVSFPKKPIMPGTRDVIRVTYDPKGQSGVFLKAIQVLSTTPDKRQILTVKGEVYP